VRTYAGLSIYYIRFPLPLSIVIFIPFGTRLQWCNNSNTVLLSVALYSQLHKLLFRHHIQRMLLQNRLDIRLVGEHFDLSEFKETVYLNFKRNRYELIGNRDECVGLSFCQYSIGI